MAYKFIEILDSLDKLTEQEAIALIGNPREGVVFIQKVVDSFIQEGCMDGAGRNIATTLYGALYVDALLSTLAFFQETNGDLQDALKLMRGSTKEMIMFFYALGKVDERARLVRAEVRPMTLKEKILFLWRGK